MAVYETPVKHEDHYIHQDSTGGTGAGFWAVVAILAVVLLLLLFGSNFFGRGTTTNENTGGTNIEGSVNVQ